MLAARKAAGTLTAATGSLTVSTGKPHKYTRVVVYIDDTYKVVYRIKYRGSQVIYGRVEPYWFEKRFFSRPTVITRMLKRADKLSLKLMLDLVAFEVGR